MSSQLEFRIEGLDCPGCATDTENILLQLDGILSVSVSYSKEMIAVEYDPEITDGARIITAVKRIGFKARIA